MKVLFITYPMAFHTPGGGEIQLLAYKKHLEKKGIQVDLFDPWNPRFLDYDLVHYFSCVGGSIHICNFIKQLGLPLVITSSLWLEENDLIKYPIDEIKYQLNLADYIITNSISESYNLSNYLDISIEKFEHVYNGFDKVFLNKVNGEIFKSEYNINEGFVLNIANIEERKNQISLLSAIKNYPELKLVLMGNIRDQLYYEKIMDLDEYDQVRYLGYFNNESEILRSAISACKLFCLPSTLETPGLSALEAVAQGAQIAVTKIGSTSEYFGNTIASIDPKNVNSIIQAIRNSNVNDNIIDVSKFSWDKVVERLVYIYEKTINKG